MRTSKDFIKKDVVTAIAAHIVLPLLLGFDVLFRLNFITSLIVGVAVILVWIDLEKYSERMIKFLRFTRWVAMFNLIQAAYIVALLAITTLLLESSVALVLITAYTLIVAFLYYHLLLEWSVTLDTKARIDGKKYRRRISMLIALSILKVPLVGVVASIVPGFTDIESIKFEGNSFPERVLNSMFES